jgi:predicted RND superfamily exporter protein
MDEQAVEIAQLGAAAEVGIAIAAIAVWILLMVLIGKWPQIRGWINTTVFRRSSATPGA